jgi:hypothetical protein
MVLSTWLHTTLLYEGLDNLFALPNLQTPSFKFSQVVFVPLQKIVLMSSQNKLLSQQLCKTTSLTYDLKSIWNFGETWKTMSTTFSQNFSLFNIIKWDILLLPWSHLKLGLEHKMTYNLQLTLNNSKLLEILRDTLNICFLYLLKISALLMVTTKSYHFEKELISKLKLKL